MKADRPKSAGALRQERYRDRQRLDVISLPPGEISRTTVEQLVKVKWFPAGALTDKQVTIEALVDWANDIATQLAKRSGDAVTDGEGDAVDAKK